MSETSLSKKTAFDVIAKWKPDFGFVVKKTVIDGHALKLTTNDGLSVEIRFPDLEWKMFEDLMQRIPGEEDG